MTTHLAEMPAGNAMQLTLFDYSGLSEDAQFFIKKCTTEIRYFAHRTGRDILEIGQKLIEVRDRIGGRFSAWLDAEFQWSERVARQFILVAEKLPYLPRDVEIDTGALYLLAKSSTPESAREEAVERASAGERITKDTAQEIVAGHKASEPKQRRLDQPSVAHAADLAHKALAGLSPDEQKKVIEQRQGNMRDEAKALDRPGERERKILRGVGFLQKAKKAFTSLGDEAEGVVKAINAALGEAEYLPE